MTDYSATATLARSRATSKSMDVLLGLLNGMLADGELNALEIQMLSTWLAQHQEVTTVWPGSFVAEKLRTILADGVISEDERSHLQDSLKQLATNNFAETGSASPELVDLPFDATCAIEFDGARICLTGEFIYGTRAQCEELTAGAGAVLRDTVNGKTDFVVVGTHISPSWAHTSFGRKIQQAMDVQIAGGHVKIISEERWLHALQRPQSPAG